MTGSTGSNPLSDNLGRTMTHTTTHRAFEGPFVASNSIKEILGFSVRLDAPVISLNCVITLETDNMMAITTHDNSLSRLSVMIEVFVTDWTRFIADDANFLVGGDTRDLSFLGHDEDCELLTANPH